MCLHGGKFLYDMYVWKLTLLAFVPTYFQIFMSIRSFKNNVYQYVHPNNFYVVILTAVACKWLPN